MIERKSIVDQIEVPITGGVMVRLALQLVEDGVVLSSKFHRTIVPADISPAEQMTYVNEHLTKMGEAPVSSDEVQRIGMFHKLAVQLPSPNAPEKTIEEAVAEIKVAEASREVKPT